MHRNNKELLKKINCDEEQNCVCKLKEFRSNKLNVGGREVNRKKITGLNHIFCVWNPRRRFTDKFWHDLAIIII